MQKTTPPSTGTLSSLPDDLLADRRDAVVTPTATQPSFIVGIGASAGGLDSLEKLFRNMPDRTGLAFVVIQHLSPDYKSMMVELLSKHTRMAIKQAEDGMSVQADTVYLIPPKVSLTIAKGALHLATRDSHTHALHLPIDIFFRSLAEDLEGRAIGIVLSGTGSDGTLGSRAIKEAGGMLMVQEPASAPFDGMPNSAIHTGLADYVAPPEAIPHLLLKYVKHPLSALADKIPPSSKDEDMLMRILDLIKEETGLDFSYYKPSTVIRRIERRMGVNQIEKLEHYHRYLEKNPSEIQVLYSELLIGVTRFFRDNEAFDIIQQQVIPELIKNRKENPRMPIRIWVAGCSSGEEVYSLAILISEYFQAHNLSIETKIFATDIDHRAVDIAAAGKYPASIVSDVPMPLLGKYFFKSDDFYQVVEKIRKMVIFAQHNLLKDPPFNNLDLVACRNLLIYLRNDMQQKVLSMFGFALKKGGFLFLGSSETVGNLSDLFSTFDNKWRVYRYKGGANFADFRFFTGERTEEHARATLYQPQQRHVPTPHEPDTVMQRIQSHLLDFHVPPTVVLDHDFNLVHTIGDVNEFLQIPKGQFTFNIFKLMDKNLSGLVSNALRKSQKSKEAVRYNDVQLTWKGNKIALTLLIEPFTDQKTKRRFFLLTFQGAEKVLADFESTQEVALDNNQELRIQDLENELQLTRENLQATIEELETSNEELQATNEELMSANEELQSTNEELQSVNEELYTVNSEYQNKIEELTSLNNDMNNLLSSTNIGTMFLDGALRIRKFTPAVKEQFPIMDHDVGRPISHFAANFDYPRLIDDLRQVLASSTALEKDVKLKNGKTYQVSIQPYRTTNNSIDGLVLAFIDISRRLKMESDLRASQELLEIAATIATDGFWDWPDTAADQQRWSTRFYELLGYAADEIAASFSTFRGLLHSEDREPTLQTIEAHLKDLTPFNIECRLRTKSDDYRWYQLRGQYHFDENDQPGRLAGALTDIHDWKTTQQELAEKENLFHKLIEAATHFIWLTDTHGNALRLNKAWCDITGRSEAESLGEGWIQALHPEDIDRVFRGWKAAASKDDIITNEGRFLLKDGSYRRYQILGIPVKNNAKEIINWVGIDAEADSVERIFTETDGTGPAFHRVYELAPFGVALHTLEGRFITVNRTLAELLGYPEDELKTLCYQDITPADYGEEDEKQRQRLLQTGSSGPYHKVYRHRDGHSIRIILHSVLDIDSNENQYFWSYVQKLDHNTPSSP